MIITSLDDFHSTNPLPFETLPLTDKRKLPNCPAVYLLIDQSNTILYIGETEQLVLRWLSHDQLHLQLSYDDLRIAWIECSDTSLLKTIEWLLIQRFDPPYNKQKPSTCTSTPESTHPYSSWAYLNTSDTSPLMSLVRDKQITSNCWRVLMIVLHHLDHENRITITQAEVATILGKCPTNISALFKILHQKGLIERDHKKGNSFTFRLNPLLACRGDASSFKVHLHRQSIM
jgi:hypothetical protein